MSVKSNEINDKYLNKFTDDFDQLVSEEKMNINSLEDIMVCGVNEFEKELRLHIEELLKFHIDEQKRISEKNGK